MVNSFMNVSWQPSQCRPGCASQAMFLKRDKGTCYVLSVCTTQQGDASLDSELRQELQGVSKRCGDPCLTIGGNLSEEIYQSSKFTTPSGELNEPCTILPHFIQNNNYQQTGQVFLLF